VRLPNRLPDDACTEATATLHTIAGDDCRRAAGGDHVRNFRWSADYNDQNWTQLLLPFYTTYYLDDEKQPQVLLVNGQTGALNGRKRASMKRAFRWAAVIAALALILFVAGTIMSLVGSADVLEYGRQAISLAFFTLIAATFPVIFVWYFNHTH
jgi:hypothetical protein